ncbi:hypothetical protein [Streptomyces sp. NPDC051662]|uniref:hypothetical protein n=1 Tax=Streptomyces sp. NPDC051662 TaxID=3154750 RepID=UPI003413FB7C
MSDRRRRTALHLPPPSGPVLLPRERQSSSTGPSGTSKHSGAPGQASPGSGSPDSSSSGSPDSSSPGSAEDNPFAPPPEGRPDQPWQPRHPEHGGNASNDGSGPARGGWGSQWSSRQPGRSQGGFGSRPGGQNGQSGQNGQGSGKDGPDGGRGGLRWDPTDPAQRRARYALLSGMWAFFFALFDFPEIALLLGALALYWGISSLRNKSRTPSSDTDGAAADGTSPAAVRSARTPAETGQPGQAGQTAQVAQTGQAGETGRAAAFGGPGQSGAALPASSRPQTTAAVSGLVTAVIALAIVATTFTVQLVYRDYYTCLNDALTTTGQLSCNDLLPDSLVPVFGVKE